MESALYGVYTLVVLYQKSHSFASLTRSISDTPQRVCKHRTHALSMKYSTYVHVIHWQFPFLMEGFCMVPQNKERVALLVYQTNPVGYFFLFLNTSFVLASLHGC